VRDLRQLIADIRSGFGAGSGIAGVLSYESRHFQFKNTIF
jgi:hypothetical protein